jgi:DNA-binding transcriptional regulator GbsR (MarR family)
MPIDLTNEKSAMAYLEQATQELSKDILFTNEKDFTAWVTSNFKEIVKRASDLNMSILEKVLKNPAAKEAIVDEMARNIHTSMNK